MPLRVTFPGTILALRADHWTFSLAHFLHALAHPRKDYKPTMSAPKYLESYDLATREVAEHVLQYGMAVTLAYPTKGLASQARQRFSYLAQVMAKTENPLRELARKLRVTLPVATGEEWSITVAHADSVPVAVATGKAFEEWKKANGVTLATPMGAEPEAA